MKEEVGGVEEEEKDEEDGHVEEGRREGRRSRSGGIGEERGGWSCGEEGKKEEESVGVEYDKDKEEDQVEDGKW